MNNNYNGKPRMSNEEYAKIMEKYGNKAARAATIAQKQYLKTMRNVNLTNTSFMTADPNR